MTTKNGKQENVDCLYDIVRKEYVPGSKVLAKETKGKIKEFAKTNTILKNSIDGKATIEFELELYSKDAFPYGEFEMQDRELRALIGRPIDKIYRSLKLETSHLLIDLAAGVTGTILGGTYFTMNAAYIETIIGAAFGTALGYIVAQPLIILVDSLREREPMKRVRLLDEVASVYKKKNMIS